MLLAGVIYEKLVDYDLYHLYGMVWYILIPIHAISLCQESHRMNRTQRITNPMPTSAIPKTAAVCRLRLPPAPTQPSKQGQFHLFCLTFKRCSCLPYQTTVFAAVTVCAHNAQAGVSQRPSIGCFHVWLWLSTNAKRPKGAAALDKF